MTSLLALAAYALVFAALLAGYFRWERTHMAANPEPTPTSTSLDANIAAFGSSPKARLR